MPKALTKDRAVKASLSGSIPSLLHVLPYSDSRCCDNHWPKPTGEERGFYISQPRAGRSQGRNQEARTVECCLLPCTQVLDQLPFLYTLQSPVWGGGDGATHSGLDPPTSISTQENLPQTLMEAAVQLRIPLPSCLYSESTWQNFSSPGTQKSRCQSPEWKRTTECFSIHKHSLGHRSGDVSHDQSL